MTFETITSSPRKGIFAILAVASVLLLSTGCTTQPVAGGSGGGSSSGDSANGDGDGSGQSDADGSDADTDGSDADGSDSDASGDDSSSGTLTGAECLPGNWYLDNARFGKLMSSAAGTVDNVTGTVMLTLTADGHTHTHYDNWSHEITVSSSTITIVKNGTDDGTYTVTSDGAMTMVDAEINSTTVSEMEINGKKVAKAVSPEPSVFSKATFHCSGDELTVTAKGNSAVMHREH